MNRWHAYQVLIFVSPLPFGGDVIWAWSLYSLTCFTLLLLEFNEHLKAKKPIKLPKALIKAIPIIALLLTVQAVVALQLFISPTPLNHANYLALIKGLSLSLFLPLTILVLKDAKRIKRAIWVIIFAAAFQATYGAIMVLSGLEWSFFSKKTLFHGAATGTFNYRNHFAGYLEMSLALGIGFLLTQSKPLKGSWRQKLRQSIETLLSPKIIMRLLLAIMVIALVLSRSRMGNTAFFASLLISGALALLLMKNKSRSTIILLSSLLIIDIAIVGTFFGVEKVAQRLQATSAKSEVRDEIVRDTFNIWQQHPVLGVGAGNYKHTYPSNRGPDLKTKLSVHHAFNDYLEFLTEFGLIAFILLAGAVLWPLYWSIKAMQIRNSSLHKGLGFGACMGITAILIHSSVDYNLQIPANAFMFIFLLALACIARWAPSRPSRRQHL
jgi:O-antigen ligase